jgi:hypothetical protein
MIDKSVIFINKIFPDRLRGPVTFTGTPDEVVRSVRKWAGGRPTAADVIAYNRLQLQKWA